MKKVALVFLGLFFFTASKAQTEFAADFEKVFISGQKANALVKEFQAQFSYQEMTLLFTSNQVDNLLNEHSISESRLKELKEAVNLSYTSHLTLITKLYGSVSNFNYGDYVNRLSKYFESKVQFGAGCSGCQSACAALYFQCISGCDSEYCHGQCDHQYYDICLPSCPCN